MSSKQDDRASRPDEDNPEWTAEDIAQGRPASEVLPQLIGKRATQELLQRRRGRPPKAAGEKKVNQTLRLDADVVEAYRHLGSGWQRRMNDVLREKMPKQKHQ